MKLLIITQAVNTQDTTLGFFHAWIVALAQRVDAVEVICLRKGEYSLPENVRVHSLGKEAGVSRMGAVWAFLKYVWHLRGDYDAVFVHMNQEYVLLGGLFWRLSGKRICLWRNHSYGDVWTRLAVHLSDVVCYVSNASFTARYRKAVMMPAGIDTSVFQKTTQVEKVKSSLLMFGRIAPVKHIEEGIDVLAGLSERGVSALLDVVGDVQPVHLGYMQILRDRVSALGLSDSVRFYPGVPHVQAPSIFQSHEVFLNFTPSGSFDKTVIEALACGNKVLVSNTSMEHILPSGSVTTGRMDESVEKLEHLLAFDDAETKEYSERAHEIVDGQSLETLIGKLVTCIYPKTA